MFQCKQVPKSHGTVNKNLFLLVGDKKWTRNDLFDNKEHEELVPGPGEEKMALGPTKTLHKH